MYNTKCLVCKSNNIKTLAGYEKHDLVQCRSCRFVFMRRIPTIEELTAHYSLYPYDKEQFLSPVTIVSYNNLLQTFNQYKSRNTVLDYGCGQGWLLDVARENGWKTYGTEYSAVAVDKCRKKGITMHQGELNPANYEPESFDVIIMSEVIEHINNPEEELIKMFSLLRKGGLLYITTPNFNCYLRYYLKEKYHIIEYPEHLSYYTMKTLNRVLVNTGFKKVKMETTGVSITHFTQSVNSTAEIDHSVSGDEKLRNLMERNALMKSVKRMANRTLTFLGLGMTLKAYYIK